MALARAVSFSWEPHTLPEGLLVAPPRLIHPQIRVSRTVFAPRPKLMAEIASAMTRAGGNSQHMVAAVAGMAGAGKTVLARNFAVEHEDAYHAVWWIDAERRDASRTSMFADIAALGVELSERIKNEAQTDIEKAARDTLRLLPHRTLERDRERSVPQDEHRGRVGRIIRQQERMDEGERESGIGFIGINHLAIAPLERTRPIAGRRLRM
jgi:hypothetical protein